MMNMISRLILLSFLLLNGCSAHINPVLERRPLVQPLPLTVGVYFSPEFRAYQVKKICILFGSCTFKYDLGPQSVAMFELILAGMFDSVVAIETLSPQSASSLGIAGIIEPKITNFNANLNSMRPDITYQITLYSPAGVELGAWEVVGNLRTTVGAVKFLSDVGELARLAMRDAATTFIKGFRQEPVVKRWLEGTNIAPKGTLSEAGQLNDRKGGQL